MSYDPIELVEIFNVHGVEESYFKYRICYNLEQNTNENQIN